MAELYDEAYQAASKRFKEALPGHVEAYQAWKRKVEDGEVLDKKTTELIALAAGLALQCSYCIDAHSQKAKARGATKEEIAAVIHIAASVKAGATVSYGIPALKPFGE